MKIERRWLFGLSVIVLTCLALPARGAQDNQQSQLATTGPSDGCGAVDATPLALDIKALKQRLKNTDAIGLFTKLKLKGEVTDLLDALAKHHAGEGSVSLEQLKERYNLLLHKVLSLLQHHDDRLGEDISASRQPLWCALADPARFSHLSVATLDFWRVSI